MAPPSQPLCRGLASHAARDTPDLAEGRFAIIWHRRPMRHC